MMTDEIDGGWVAAVGVGATQLPPVAESLMTPDEMDERAIYTLVEKSPLNDFFLKYQKIHGYLAIVVCSFGIISNIMNIVVLTRPSMLGATNYLLTALAVVDMLTMTSYLPYATYLFCFATPDHRYPHARGWVVYLLVSNNLFITFHTSAMWLTVALAVFRYFVVCRHSLGTAGAVAMRRARMTVVVVPAMTVLFCAPNYFMYRPEVRAQNTSNDLALNYSKPASAEYYNTLMMTPGTAESVVVVGYWFVKNDFVSPALEIANMLLYGVVLKVAPCVLLAVLSGFLLRAMRAADQRRRRLVSQGKQAESERTVEHNRTTAMLVAVVLFFVLSELPQGVLALLGCVNMIIYYSILVPLGDVCEIIVLVNSAVNFVLYCIMSRQFRKTFRDVFCWRRRVLNGTTMTPMITVKTTNGNVFPMAVAISGGGEGGCGAACISIRTDNFTFIGDGRILVYDER